MHDNDSLLALGNACCNGAAAALLLLGRRAIAQRHLPGAAPAATRKHRALMGAAVVVSAIFLAGYLTRALVYGTKRYAGPGRGFYLALLGSHMFLAMLVPPLVGVALWFAWRGRFDGHRRVVRWLWPMWLYVSLTGIVVYLLLYSPW